MSKEAADNKHAIASEVFQLVRTGRQVSPFSSRQPDFDIAAAYDVAEQVRLLRQQAGDGAVGRKIGFTNQAIWEARGLSAPMWNFMFDSTVRDLAASGDFDLAGLCEPRIEPEIAFGFARPPTPDMDEDALFGCLAWAAHAFEIVHSIFPGWSFTVPDAVAGFGLHGALLLGERRALSGDRHSWASSLSSFTVELTGGDGARRSGGGRNVLGSPLTALRFLVREIDRFAGQPLRAGEIVTTGTLTEAMPIRPGELWSTGLSGIGMDGISVRLR